MMANTLRSQQQGHKVWWADLDSGEALLFCRQCGAYTHKNWRSLLRPCEGGSGQTRTQLKKILQGVHPTKKAHVSSFRKVPLTAATPVGSNQHSFHRDVRRFVLCPQALQQDEVDIMMQPPPQDPGDSGQAYAQSEGATDEEEQAARALLGEDFWT